MKILVALVMGLCSGLMIYFLAAFTFASPSSDNIGPIFVLITFLGGWAASTWLLLKGARSVSKVFARGFLLGAAEWLILIPASMIMAGKLVSSTLDKAPASDAAAAGAALGGGIFTFLTGGLAVAMALVCLIGFTISYLLGREMKPEAATATKKCPDCAEMVQAEAKKCRFCGSVFGESPSEDTPRLQA